MLCGSVSVSYGRVTCLSATASGPGALTSQGGGACKLEQTLTGWPWLCFSSGSHPHYYAGHTEFLR